jgi:hypothetical protein
MYVQEDATQTVNDLILVVNPEDKTTGYDPVRKVGVTFGLPPDAAFDIEERQSNGTIKTRTFQAKYFATVDNLGPVYPPGSMPVAPQNQPAPKTVPGPGASININPAPAATTKTQQTLSQSQGQSPKIVQPTLVRSKNANEMGEYNYWLDFHSPITLNYQLRYFADTTRYRLNLKAELWELKNGAWGKAKDNNSKEITESKSVLFETSKLIAQQMPGTSTVPGSAPSGYQVSPSNYINLMQGPAPIQNPGQTQNPQSPSPYVKPQQGQQPNPSPTLKPQGGIKRKT